MTNYVLNILLRTMRRQFAQGGNQGHPLINNSAIKHENMYYLLRKKLRFFFKLGNTSYTKRKKPSLIKISIVNFILVDHNRHSCMVREEASVKRVPNCFSQPVGPSKTIHDKICMDFKIQVAGIFFQYAPKIGCWYRKKVLLFFLLVARTLLARTVCDSPIHTHHALSPPDGILVTSIGQL